jgi:hypothetical protein
MVSRGRTYMDNGEVHRLLSESVSKQQMTCNDLANGPQVAISSLQQQSLGDWHVPVYMEMRHHHGDVVHGGQLNMNNKHVE